MSNAKRQAVADIKKDLQKEGKCFIMYRQDLNKVMREIVREALREQRNAITINININ